MFCPPHPTALSKKQESSSPSNTKTSFFTLILSKPKIFGCVEFSTIFTYRSPSSFNERPAYAKKSFFCEKYGSIIRPSSNFGSNFPGINWLVHHLKVGHHRNSSKYLRGILRDKKYFRA